jgi:hypothetical protein
MNIEEYWKEFVNAWAEPNPGDIPVSIAPILNAGFKAKIPPEQLLQFHIDYLKTKNVICAFNKNTVTARDIEKIEIAYQAGCVKPDEVLRTEFTESEVHERYRKSVFGSKNT